MDSPHARPMSPFQERVFRTTAAWLGAAVTAAHRLSNGRVGNTVPGGAPVCLLTTTGRRTGRARTVPLVFLARGDDLVVVASNGGAGADPAWALNLRDDPRAVVQVGAVRHAVVARETHGGERAALWAGVVAIEPQFEAYRRRSPRPIPVVVLHPVEAHG